MSNLFINSNSNILPTFPATSISTQNIMTNISNGLGFSNIENNNLTRPLNLNFNSMNQISPVYETNYLNTSSFSKFENIKKNNLEIPINSNNITSINKTNKNNQDNPKINDGIKEFKGPHLHKILSRPFVTNTAAMGNSNTKASNSNSKKKEFLNKIRRRSIKNNKIVFVHSANAAARKLANEAIVKIF